MTTRRAFLRALGLGTVATLATLHVPAGAMQALALPTKEYACVRLREEFLRYVKAHGIKALGAFHVGREFYVAYEEELPLFARYVSTDAAGWTALMFKGFPVIETGRGWYVRGAR